MSKLEQINFVRKYLSEGDIKNLNKLSSAVENGETILTCMGLYNHGKSTLLNTLIKDLNNDTFKTSDVRETTQSKRIKYEDIIYVDTPGLNAKEHDDKRVMDAVKESDLNLFVHSVTTGEFVEKEIEFLNNIKMHWRNPKEFINSTIFVLSRMDKANDEDDIEKEVEKINQQIVEIFECEPTVVPVSAIRYQKGILKNSKLFIAKSRIEELESVIHAKKYELNDSINKTKKERLQASYDNLIRRLNSKIEENKLEISKQNRVLTEYSDSLALEIKIIENSLESMYSELEE